MNFCLMLHFYCSAPSKHEVLNRLKEHIDTKYQMPKELELKLRRELKVNSIIKTRSMTLKNPRKNPPEVIFEDQDVSDGEYLDSSEVIEIPE